MINDSTTPTALRQSFLNLRKTRRHARERFLAGPRPNGTTSGSSPRSRARSATSLRHGSGGRRHRHRCTDSTLNRYADILTPWANQSSAVWLPMCRDATRRHGNNAREIGQTFAARSPTPQRAMRCGGLAGTRSGDHVTAPEAAERLFKLTTEAVTTSTRAKEMKPEILASGRVRLATAKMLAHRRLDDGHGDHQGARRAHRFTWLHLADVEGRAVGPAIARWRAKSCRGTSAHAR